MKRFSGIGVALVTPFSQDRGVDENSLKNLVEYVTTEGVDYLVALGTTSEYITLSQEERERVVEIIVQQNNNRLPLVIGVGGYNTAEVVDEMNRLSYLKKGDAILSVTPYYNKPTQDGLYRHFSTLAEVAPLPIILYNVPGRTSVNMTAATTLKLAYEFDNIIGIKEASGNSDQITDIIRKKPEHFLVLSGDDGLTLPIVALGGDGVISVIGNVLPAAFSRLVHYALGEDFSEARRIQYLLSDLYRYLFEEGNPAGVKAALQARGVIHDRLTRLPLCEASEELYKKIREELSQLPF